MNRELVVYLRPQAALLCVPWPVRSAILFALTASFFALLGVAAAPFYLYIMLKSVFSAMTDAFAACAALYAICTG